MIKRTKEIAKDCQTVFAVVVANELTNMLRQEIIARQLDNSAIISVMSALAADGVASINEDEEDDDFGFKIFNSQFKKMYGEIDEEDFSRLAYSGLGLTISLNSTDKAQIDVEISLYKELLQRHDNYDTRSAAEDDAMNDSAEELFDLVEDFLFQHLGDRTVGKEELMCMLSITACTYIKSIDLFNSDNLDAFNSFMSDFKDRCNC